jgi:AcrR family transcriptional regulator
MRSVDGGRHGAEGDGPVARAPRTEPSASGRTDQSVREPDVQLFTMSVLAERSGTSIPTIHHYWRMGLLPPAVQTASNRFYYDERHVEALDMIRLLRERRNLPLEAIREVLPELLALKTEQGLDPDDWDRAALRHLERSSSSAIADRLVAAARTLFAERGYAAVNVSDICRSAQVAKGSFYRYFDSKEAIFLEAARSTIDAVGDQLDQLPSGLTERQATEKLQHLMRPMAPLLLEAATFELMHQPVVGVMSLIVTGLATRLMPRLKTRGAAAATVARRAVDVAVTGLLRPALHSNG